MKALFPIIPRTKIWILLGIIIMVLGLASFFSYQRYSIQFTGGIELVVDASEINVDLSEILQAQLVEAGFTPGSVSIGKKDTFATVLVQMKLSDDKEVQQVTETLNNTLREQNVISSGSEILEQSIIWPSIGEYMKRSAVQAVVRGIIFMTVYILFAFAGMRQLVSPALLGVITVLTMLFDIAFPAGMYGLWMATNSAIQIDAVFIIAILTVMWYSINDTIIIFDRVRENYLNKESHIVSGKLPVSELFETSLRQTMKRSIGTSLTTFLVVAAMRIFGTGALKLFAFTFGMWVISGSFSSIFFAAPLAYIFSKKTIAAKK